MAAERFGGLEHQLAALNYFNIQSMRRGALFDSQTLIIWTKRHGKNECVAVTPEGLTEDMIQAANRALGAAPPTPRWQRT